VSWSTEGDGLGWQIISVAARSHQVSQPADDTTAHEGAPASTDVRIARLLVAGQFVLIGILVLLPGRLDWPVPAALKVACSIATIIGLAVMFIGATGLGRGLTATPLPNAHAKLRTGGLYRYARHPILQRIAAHDGLDHGGLRKRIPTPRTRSAGPAPDREGTLGGNTPDATIRGIRRLRRAYSTVRTTATEVTERGSVSPGRIRRALSVARFVRRGSR
jgi:hypothetical protein